MADKWTPAELKKLKKLRDEKPAWMTDNELASRLVSQFKKSKEAIRWQLRHMHVLPQMQHAKILLLDIETLPIEAKVFGTWKQNIQPYQIKKDWSIACWSAKWLFDDKVYGEVVTPQEAIARTEESVLESIWNMVNEAHIVVAHNGSEFDFKKLNTKFLMYGYPKPMYSKEIDTLKIAKENFSFTYNKMDWINKLLGIGTKIETSFTWWDEASEGNKKYLDMMLEYNMQDVNILEELYLKLRPWMKGHPNMAIYSVHTNVSCCPTCGSLDLDWGGTYSTGLGLYRAFRCQDCGSIGRSTKKQYKLSSAESQG